MIYRVYMQAVPQKVENKTVLIGNDCGSIPRKKGSGRKPMPPRSERGGGKGDRKTKCTVAWTGL